jgi:hypothetical protein
MSDMEKFVPDGRGNWRASIRSFDDPESKQQIAELWANELAKREREKGNVEIGKVDESAS